MPTTYAWPLIAIRFDGHTIPLMDVAAVRAFEASIRRANESWGDKHRHTFQCHHPFAHQIQTYYHWVIRDDLGRTVTPDAFYDAYVSPRPAWYARRHAAARAAAEKGLPIPGTGCAKAGWKINHTAKKNSGRGHRSRNRALAIYEAREYGVRNNVGNRVIRWEDG